MGLPFLKRLDMLIEGCLDAHFVFCWTPPLPCTHPEMTKLLPVMTNSWQLELKEHTKACLKKRKSETRPISNAKESDHNRFLFPTEQDTVQDPAHLVSY